MLNSVAPMWILGGWFAAVAGVVAWSVSMDARLSTTALVILIGMTPAAVMGLMRAGAPAPTVAEILRSVNAKDGRS